MAQAWYPVIDYTRCTECGSCVAKCSHGVYDQAKAPVPVVKHPEHCIDHCHGCGNVCPVGAITYVGEDTGWSPQAAKGEAENGSCGCECGAATEKKVVVEYLYLDLSTCERCVGTDNELDEVMKVLSPALELAGYAVEYKKIKMATAAIAKQYRFLSSPTIRVNGRDICDNVAENDCGCCSEISGTDVDCRVFEYAGQTYEVPPKEMLASAILDTVFSKVDGGCGRYELPDNLAAFFQGKNRKSCSCEGGCC